MDIQSHIRVKDGELAIVIKFRLWGDKAEGRGMVRLDPADNPSHHFMITERPTIKAMIGARFDLGQVVLFESQGNGLYTADRDGQHLANGSSIDAAKVNEIGNNIHTLGWDKAQEMSNLRMPPPTPFTSWPK